MKILFTGGGSGGHFYPIIAIAQAINEIVLERRLVPAKLYFMSDTPYDQRALFENHIEFKRAAAGKTRRYFSLANFFDFFKTTAGLVTALLKLFLIYPDVVMGKGGYASFPALFSARLLGIPVLIHESDAKPGRVNLWAGKFAKRIAVAFEEAAGYFPKEKTALVGNPVRRQVLTPVKSGASEFFDFHENLPTILVLGGSQGAQAINDIVVDILPQLVENYHVIHQAGKKNIDEVAKRVSVILNERQTKRYRNYPYLDDTALAFAAGASDLVISRAGAGAISEIAAWGKPSIIIPIPVGVSHDQTRNGFLYGKTGAAILVEEENLKGHILLSEINRLMADENLRKTMAERARSWSRPDSARLIAEEILRLGLKHEK